MNPPECESMIPAALAKLRTKKYLRMVEQIMDADETSVMGACMIGLIEGAIWDRCQQVPTRAMILEASRCQSYDEAFALEERLVAQIQGREMGAS
jgi:hypothetical protein